MVGVTQVVLAWLGASSGVVKDIKHDSHFFGHSPAVYPSPIANGTGDWAAAYQKAHALVKQMTLQEKADLTYGWGTSRNGCSGEIQGIERLGFPGLCLQDAGNGVRATDFVSGFPSGIHVGASWNKDLSYQRGHAMGGEFRAKGIHVMLGPVVGPLGRIAVNGRNWEGFSNDPYLCGALGFETVKGAQERGVITSTKHYIANEQETNREPSRDLKTDELIEAVSSNIDDATLHELYLWPFQDVLRAGAANIMCSYNRVNNSYGCANSKLLNGILKTELGFQGFVVSDWNAQHAGVATANAGLDMAMPSGWLWQDGLPAAVKNGSIKASRVDDMATRIIATWYKLGQDKGFPDLGVGLPNDLQKPHKIVDARDRSSKKILLDGAIEGHVLVKNTKSILPLKKPRILSLFGYSATIPGQFDISTSWVLGTEASCPGCRPVFYTGAKGPQIAVNGTLHTGGGSGANTPTYISSPYEAIAARAYEDDTQLFWDFTTLTDNPTVDASSDACLVFINAMATEALDREVLHDEYSDNLILNVASKCANTIVVIHNAGIRLVDAFIDHENVTAVIFAHLPGQDSGRALAAILYGDVSPSGKLPYTVAKNAKDYGRLAYPAYPKPPHSFFPQDDFKEGVYIDYRAFDKAGLKPRFEFGFGLSYTTFSYSGLSITPLPSASHAKYPSGVIVQGGVEDLWDVLVSVSATITNTGKVHGKEVAQLYVAIPGGPVRQLRGFEKVALAAGQNAKVDFALTRRDLSMWDTVAQKWMLQKGRYSIWVGASSRDLRLKGEIKI